MTIFVRGIDLMVPKEYGKTANFGKQMLMHKNHKVCINYSLRSHLFIDG